MRSRSDAGDRYRESTGSLRDRALAAFHAGRHGRRSFALAFARGVLELEDRPERPCRPERLPTAEQRLGRSGLFADRSAAEAAFAEHERCLPLSADTVESWHALLLPIAHRGECNYLERTADRTSFTRLRVLETRGRRNGSDPFDIARGQRLIGVY